MFGFIIDHSSELSNAKQLEKQIREAILSGGLAAGDRLPPTRALAKDMQIARNTVIQAYEQLLAEGYLDAREGSGTYVAEIGRIPVPKEKVPLPKTDQTVLRDVISFDAGNPDIGSFPRAAWARMLKEACLDADEEAFGYTYFSGHPRLKRAIRDYAYRIKGLQCEERQILIVPGAAGGLELLAKVFADGGKRIALEDPCMHFVKKIFADHRYELYPVEVDGQGMEINRLQQLSGINLVYVVPSHQYPIGGVIPISRRIALLQYAGSQNAYVLEDDYDSEFRYKGEALQAMHNLDQERVIYIGSFSKIFAPSLRLGYMILPVQLIDKVARQLQESNLWTNTLEQLAMAGFMEELLLDKHIYRMRKLYENKRRELIRCLKDAFGESIRISGEYAGLHLLVTFDRELTEGDLISMSNAGVEADYVEEYAMVKGRHKNRLVLGYGALSQPQIEEGVKRLKRALSD
jgi:GntR family transcriptional regulator / MocR family aminotransferase